MVASYADALWARHAIFLPQERGGGRLRDEPKEYLHRRLQLQWNTYFLNPGIFDSPDNSNQMSLSWPQSNSYTNCNFQNFTPDFSQYPIFRTNFRRGSKTL